MFTSRLAFNYFRTASQRLARQTEMLLCLKTSTLKPTSLLPFMDQLPPNGARLSLSRLRRVLLLQLLVAQDGTGHLLRSATRECLHSSCLSN